jgi:hypothetical protein
MKRWISPVVVVCLLGELSAAEQNRFPYGRGTDLTASQLHGVSEDPSFKNQGLKQQLDLAVAKHGKAHKVEGDTHVWYGVHGRNVVAPWGCRELRISPTDRSHGPSDHHNCGLPYAQYTGARDDVFKGLSAARDLGDLRKVEQSLVKADPIEKRWEAAKSKLGAAARDDGKSRVWFGIGGRDDQGPISCHMLSIGPDRIAIAPAKYEDCGLSWPPATPEPAVAAIAPVSLTAAEKDCFSRCKERSFCVIERRVVFAAGLRQLGGGQWAARYMDGRPAPMSFVPTCRDLPAACDKEPTSACLGEPIRNKNEAAICRPGQRSIISQKTAEGRLYWICEYAEDPPKAAR